ncbi:transglutaminase-like cysteine peptidase [Cohaesibacter celericrescens]|uniref:transglutaminase-like cysteine peptidase n=1 Tax=Cohaesibacter celericrescens TaxID=2067669 RepID=UPI0015E06869|nr:transglutaminase-like cysteine peptidase [Cohaesibacter celericrescens]
MYRHKKFADLIAVSALVTGVMGSVLVSVGQAHATGSSAFSMRVTQRTSTPAGHVYYCANEPKACARHGKGVKILTEQNWKQLVKINSSVNNSIKAVEDGQIDQWSVYVKEGDCEDYALTKQRELLRNGWSSDSLLITTAYLPDGAYHAVLVVRTDRGEFILDNLNPLIQPWQSVKYRWNKRQAVGNPQIWQSIAGAPNQRNGQSVGSLNPKPR